MSQEERQKLCEDSTLISVRIDDYQLPSLLIKLIKSLKKNSVAEMTTTKIDKLHRNFTSPFLDQYKAFKQGDTVVFTVSLISISNTRYFYKLSVQEKLQYV